MSENIKVSVIMPVYNDEEFLEESLSSVLNQTIKNIEIICINDGSTDNSLKILEQYFKKDNRILIINQDNLGSGIARNEGIKVAKGEYISFLDADDFYINENSLLEMFLLAKKLNSNMVSANLKSVVKGKFTDSLYCINRAKRCTVLPEEYGMPWFFFRNIFKKQFLLDNDILFPNYLRGQDPVFLSEILTKIDSIDYIPIDFYAYRYILNKKSKYDTKRKKIDYIRHFVDVFKILNSPKFCKMYSEYENHLKKFLKREIAEDEKKYLLEVCDNDVFFFKMFENTLESVNKDEKTKKLKEDNKKIKNRKIVKLVDKIKFKH